MKIPVVAWRLSVSESFVYQIIGDGRLKHHRLGKGQGGLRVSEEQLQAYLLATEDGGGQTQTKQPEAVVVTPKAQPGKASAFTFLPPKG